MRKFTRFALSALVVAGVVVVFQSVLSAQNRPTRSQASNSEVAEQEGEGKPQPSLRDFMRQKLQASNMILEGLATEDMQLVKEGSQKLNKMSGVEQWRVHNDVMYRQFSGEFQRVTQALTKAAEEDDIDRAAFQWMAATMSCIECHRYVRNELVVD